MTALMRLTVIYSLYPIISAEFPKRQNTHKNKNRHPSIDGQRFTI